MTDSRIARIKALYKKYREPVVYIFFGGLTTLVDFGVYLILTDGFRMNVVAANSIAWGAAVVFAFAVNKAVVFADSRTDVPVVLAQFVSFASMRALSGGLSTFFLWLFSERFGFDDLAVKAIISVAVIVLNYIFSKVFIFRKSRK